MLRLHAARAERRQLTIQQDRGQTVDWELPVAVSAPAHPWHLQLGILPPDMLSARLRGVAQVVSAPVWGTGGRRFESCLPDHTLRSESPLSELSFSAYEVQREAAEAMPTCSATGRSRRVRDESLGAGCYAAYVSRGSTEGQLPVHRVVRISRRVLKGICRSNWSDRSVFVRAIEPQANQVRQTASRENKIKRPIQAL